VEGEGGGEVWFEVNCRGSFGGSLVREEEPEEREEPEDVLEEEELEEEPELEEEEEDFSAVQVSERKVKRPERELSEDEGESWLILLWGKKRKN